MNKLSIIFPVMLLLASCTPEPNNKHLNYQNIVIMSDMSSRIRNVRFPQKDTVEIHKIIQYFKTDCVRPGKKIGDNSSLSFSAFSEKNTISIDLDKMKDIGGKQSFVNSTGKYEKLGLENKLIDFEQNVKSRYTKISNPGLDLISLLIEKIENDDLLKTNRVTTDGIDTTYINFDNNIYVFTDGYLEYSSAGKVPNGQYYFGGPEIERVRNYCKIHNINVVEALEKENSLSIPAYQGKMNKDVSLHILETQERDWDTERLSYKNPKGFRDNEILEAVWKKWAKDSGFKSLEWKKY